MESKSSIAVALLIENDPIRQDVTRQIQAYQESGEVVLVQDAKSSHVVVADFDDPMKSLPLPEVTNLAGGKPVIVIIPKADYRLTRQMFLEGAGDVLPLPELPQLLFAIRRAVLMRSPDAQRASLLNTELVYFRQLSELAGAGTDLNSFFDRIVEVVAQIMDVEIVSLMLLNERFQTLWIAAARGLDDKIVRKTSVRVGEGVSGRVAKQGRPLLIQDIEVDNSLDVGKSASRYSTKSLLSVPITVRNRVIGVLNINNKRTGAPFQESDLNMLITLSNQTGLAIDNARLVADLQSKAESLEKAYNDLKHVNKAKTELIINLSHEIKTPLTAILGYVDLMLSDPGDDPEKARSFLGKISTRSRHLNRLAERIITFFALQTGSVNWVFESESLSTILFGVADRLHGMARESGVEVFVDGSSLDYSINCDVSHIQEAFLNIVENAIQFNHEGGKVTVTGQAVSVGDRAVKVSVSDTGRGVPASIVANIFDGFVQTDRMMTDKPDGLGIGLAMSRSIFEAHGGDLTLIKNSSDGATFSVTLSLP